MRILFSTLYSSQIASSRYRVYQYLPFLKTEGIEFNIYPFYSDTYYRLRENRLIQSCLLFSRLFDKFFLIWANLKRFFNIVMAFKYDVVFIQKELMPVVLIKLLKCINSNIIFDLDDAIFLPEEKQRNYIGRVIRWRSHIKVPRMLNASKKVVVGNNYLKDYCLKFNANVSVLPIAIDLQRYFVKNKAHQENLVIGWVGSPATVFCLEILNDVFKTLCRRYPFLTIMLIGADTYVKPDDVNLVKRRWNYETEVNDLQRFDIGIMPMSKDEFTSGKGGCKLLQYMAVGVPSVASPVGINCEILEDGVNGFFADNANEWIEKISLLAEDKKLRENMGRKARETILKRYSLKAAAPQFIRIIKETK